MNKPEFSEFPMTSCPSDEILLDFTAGRLDADRSAAFERHVDGCSQCAELRIAQSSVWMSLEAWKPEPVSTGFNRELWRRIDAEEAKPSWASPIAASFGMWKRVAPLAVALALVVTGYVWDHTPKHVAQPAAVVVSASDAEQLERALDDIQLLHEVDAAAGQPASVM